MPIRTASVTTADTLAVHKAASEPPIQVLVAGCLLQGEVTLLAGTTGDGSAVLVAAEAHTCRDVAERLADGESVVSVIVEPWQLVAGGATA
jgi:hypothetical protein